MQNYDQKKLKTEKKLSVWIQISYLLPHHQNQPCFFHYLKWPQQMVLQLDNAAPNTRCYKGWGDSKRIFVLKLYRQKAMIRNLFLFCSHNSIIKLVLQKKTIFSGWFLCVLPPQKDGGHQAMTFFIHLFSKLLSYLHVRFLPNQRAVSMHFYHWPMKQFW